MNQSSSNSNEEIYDIVVIGGGLSGLTAAYELAQTDSNFLLLEAAPRLGGRIDSLYDGHSKNYLGDLGPSWVWPPYQRFVTEWLHRLNVEPFEQYETGDAVLDMDVSAPPKRQFLPGQHGMARIKGGPQALIDGLSNVIEEKRLRLGSQVKSINQLSDTLEIVCSGGQTFKAHRVICALPLRLALENIEFGALVSDACRSVMKNASTWMATQAKATIVYDTRFWREHGLSGRIASRVGPMVEVHDHCDAMGKTAALFGFVGIPHAARKSLELKPEILTQLVRCLGEDAANPLHFEVRDWHDEPLICSVLDQQTVPNHPSRLDDVIREPQANGRLFFAVSETAEESPGLIDGALEAGQRAARLALN